MRIEQIEIAAGPDDFNREDSSALAIADDVFAIHPTNFGALEFDEDSEMPTVAFTLTHRPTGYAVVVGRSWVEVLGFWSEIHARSAVDWNITDPNEVRTRLGKEFRSIRKAVEGRMLAPRQAADAVDPSAADQGTPPTRA